ncbi:MAG: hypothetical protein ACXABU_06860 [Candidatus Hodarchaeales archaeon]
MLKVLYSSGRRIIITASLVLVVSLLLSMILIQAWFDSEVKKQLNATETSINSIEVLDISYTTKSANLTINASVSNPHDIEITVAETNFSIEYHGTRMGVVRMPKIILESNLVSLVFNTTFILGGILPSTYSYFAIDLFADGEVSVNITGSLTLSAPALFFTVYSTTSINTEIVLSMDLILYSRMI